MWRWLGLVVVLVACGRTALLHDGECEPGATGFCASGGSSGGGGAAHDDGVAGVGSTGGSGGGGGRVAADSAGMAGADPESLCQANSSSPNACAGGDCSGQPLFLGSYGADSYQSLGALAVGRTGEYVIGGQNEGEIDFGPPTTAMVHESGDDQGIVALFETDGTPRWATSFDGEGTHEIRAASIAHNIVVVGSLDGSANLGTVQLQSTDGADALVASYSATGQLDWAKLFGGSLEQYAADVVTTDEGVIVVAGGFWGELDFGGEKHYGNADDGFVVSLSSSGRWLWDAEITGFLGTWVETVALAPDGSIVVAGGFESDVDFGQGSIETAGSYDFFLAKYSADGELMFAKTFGSELGQEAHDVAVDSSGNIILVGEFWADLDLGKGPMTSADTTDAFLAKFDCQGDLIWARQYGGTDYQRANEVTVDADDNIVIAATVPDDVNFETGGTGTGENGSYVFKLTASGDFIWARPFDDGSFKLLATALDGQIVVGGTYYGTIDLGDGFTKAAFGSWSDIFVARLAR